MTAAVRLPLLLLILRDVSGFALPSAAARHSSATAAAAAARAPPPLAKGMTMPSTATSLKPLQDYVLVDLQSVPAESEGGILLPTVYYAFEEKNEEVFVDPGPRAGTVVAFGPGRRSNDGKAICPMPPLKVGQKIVVGRQMGEKVVLDGESNAEATHYLFRIDELVGYCE